MSKKKILSALIGLAGAVSNNGKTEHTDRVVITALLSEDSEEAVAAIHKEKYQISPNCAVCPSPCGNTSDYDSAKFDQGSSDVKRLKEEVMEALVDIAKKSKSAGQLPQSVYKAIAFLGYELQVESYQLLLEELRK